MGMVVAGLIECVPNISAGRDLAVVESVVDAVTSVEGVYLLYVDVGKDANRTVLTYVGEASAVSEASFRLFQSASSLIDMSEHQGVHPRLGAVDVLPFVPLSETSMSECVKLSHALGERVAKELGISGYYYAEASRGPGRRLLELIRKGEYEALESKLGAPEWKPDFGPSEFNRRFGASTIGARNFLIAFNIDLDTSDLGVAQWIARRLRGSGYFRQCLDGKQHVPGRFSSVKAIGWRIPAFGNVQVSMNVTNFQQDGLTEIYRACEELSAQRDTKVLGSELIGLLPAQALSDGDETILKLSHREIFVPEVRILENALERVVAGGEPVWRIN